MTEEEIKQNDELMKVINRLFRLYAKSNVDTQADIIGQLEFIFRKIQVDDE